jgi:shikimate kinase
MKNIVLVGFMGTGKTVVAKGLAKRLKMKFVDLDDLIEEREGKKISQIFAENGEPYFRQVEKEIAREVSQQKNRVIACGGGVVLDKENVENLKRNGIMICLSARPGVVLERTKGYLHRPLLNTEDPKAKIEELLKFRAPFYSLADYTIDTSELTIEEVVGRVIEIFEKEE